MRSQLAQGLVTAAVLAVMALSGCSTASKKTSDNQESAAAAVTATNTPDSGSTDRVADNELAAGKSSGSNAGRKSALSQQELLALRSVSFDYDSYRLSQDEQAVLLAHARYLAGNRKARIEIDGHTDERGSSEYNMALGERRAKAVAAFLRSHGVPAASIQEVLSFGETKPVARGGDEAAWAQNRRAEIVYKKGAP